MFGSGYTYQIFKRSISESNAYRSFFCLFVAFNCWQSWNCWQKMAIFLSHLRQVCDKNEASNAKKTRWDIHNYCLIWESKILLYARYCKRVWAVATFESPTETAKGVQEEFGIQVTKQQSEAYDPTKKTGQDLSEELKKEFFKIRKDINKNLEATRGDGTTKITEQVRVTPKGLAKLAK